MGKSNSKPQADVTGDKDVTIINNQELHSDFHEDHAVKLNLILAIAIVQLIIVLYKMWHRRVERKAIKKVQSIADLTKV